MQVVIIGGTSGIGLALARHYLNQGHQVEVTGRDIEKIPESLYCANLSFSQFDVCSKNEIQCYFESRKNQPIDIFIYCAGKYFTQARYDLTEYEIQQVTGVNGSGFLHCFKLAAAKMQAQNKPAYLVAISSVAGVIRSSNPTLYAQLKAQMISVAEQYRNKLSQNNISVTVIAPHYMNTQKLRDLKGGENPKKAFLMEESTAVAHIVKAIEAKEALAIFPWQIKWMVKGLNLLPLELVRWILNKR
ncbi:SDR family NAD(P)-dependent oxidoreductase [Vibrio sp. E150_018]